MFVHLQGMLDAWEQRGWPSDLRHVASTMATAWHECRLNFAIREVGRGAGKAYGVPVSTTGQINYSRGACQLTWLDNYKKFGRLLYIDLVGNPELALVLGTSAAILSIGSRVGLFRDGNTLAKFFNAHTDDLKGAREIFSGDIAKNGSLNAGHHAVSPRRSTQRSCSQSRPARLGRWILRRSPQFPPTARVPTPARRRAAPADPDSRSSARSGSGHFRLRGHAHR